MKRGHKNAIVYQYGSYGRIDPPARVGDQLYLQNKFWNALVEQDLQFSERYKTLLDGSDKKIEAIKADIAAIDAIIEKSRAGIKKDRQRLRRATHLPPADKDRLAALKQEKKDFYARLKVLRIATREKIKPRLQALESERRLAVKALRQEFAGRGLYWGNYNAVLDGFEAARTKALKEGATLKFHRFTGTGRLTCQIQGGMTINDALYGSDHRLHIDPPPLAAWDSPKRGERRKLCRTVAHVRIGSGEKQTPIWFDLPIAMHRPVDPEGLIKSVAISIKKVADKIRYFLNLTVVTDAPAPVDRTGTGAVIALNTGWRTKLDGNMRIAYSVDSDGREREYCLDASYARTVTRIEGLIATRQKNFNGLRADFAAWLDFRAETVPAWLADATATLAKWRSPARLAVLSAQWRENRFAGDDEFFGRLDAWLKQDRHLWRWETNLRDKMQGRRRDYYRNIAAGLARRYNVVIINDLQLHRLRRKQLPENGVDSDSAIRHMANIAAPYLLRTSIEHAVTRDGKMFVSADARNITRDCPFCGGQDERDSRPDVLIGCARCGKNYDQDWAAAKNLLMRYMDESASKCQ